MPPVNGILETALYVSDLERSIRFYETVLGFEKLLGDERFVGMGVAGKQILLLFKEGASTKPSQTPGGTIPPHDGHGDLHLAFAISAGEKENWARHLKEQGVAVESVVWVERGGTSLYFRDPDNHLVELATPGIWPIY